MIDLSVGSPVDPVPASVREALAAAANLENAYGYPTTVGTSEVQEAISQWFLRERGVSLTDIGARALPSVGSKEAVALMASLLRLAPGSVVVQPAVSYPTYEIGTQLAGCETVKVADVADVSSWEHVPQMSMVWVNSPSNPTGKTLSVAQLAQIVAAARRIGAIVVSDECYALLRWGGSEEEGTHAVDGAVPGAVPGAASAPSILDPAACGGDATGLLCLYSLSKQSNMAGYRTAFIAGDSQILGPMLTDRKQIGLIIPGPVQAAMAAGLNDVETVTLQRGRYERRLRALVEGLATAGYDAVMPEGALYVWVPAMSGDCWSDVARLARLGIVPSPGEFYGDAGFLRFSATASDEAIAEAAKRLTEFGAA